MIGLKFILEVKQKFSILMDESSMKKYIIMLFLSFISAVLELVGVSLLLYTILAIFEPNFIDKFQLTSYLYSTLKIVSTGLIVYQTGYTLLLGNWEVK